MHIRSLLAVLALTWLAALTVVSCTGDDGRAATTFLLGPATITLPAKAPPGSSISVSITASNQSNGEIKKGDIAFAFQGDAAWKAADLPLDYGVRSGDLAAFSAKLTAPGVIGKQKLTWQPMHAGAAIGDPVSAEIDLGCDDGVYCNGAERFAGGKCVAGTDPCDDGQECTKDHCDEASGTCSHDLGPSCASCFSDCTPDCAGKQCGDDGCGGSCGSCAANEGCASVTGVCQSASQPGTCNNPIPLIGMGEQLLGQHVITGDTTTSLHQAVPTCNSTSKAVEMVYTFTLTEKTGIDARSYGYDTVLHIRKEDPLTAASECFDDKVSATVGCSDDASPPGNYGSHVAKLLDPGTYYVIVDGFDATQFGPFTLEAKLVAGCAPNCDGRYCGGDDGCGGDCGSCGAGFACKDAHCYPAPCTPDCNDKECGDDGCGGLCGQCTDGKYCVLAEAKCQSFPTCDHQSPTCEGCKDDEFCGTDCACHAVKAPMADLVVDAKRLKDEILFDTINVTADSCALVEQCVGGTGDRKLLRFSVEAVNQGQATLTVPPPDQRPDLFTYSACHGHYHFNGFANYALLDTKGEVVLTGHKQAYCMEDTEQVMVGPQVACSKAYDCSNQGIQAGWSDLYGNTLDCQWLDITDVAPGDYQVQVTLNPGHVFEEVSFSNNVAAVPVTIK